MTARFGGLKDYVEAVNRLDLEWPVLDGEHCLQNGNRDFHPYTTMSYHNNADVWSGYYTSRPKLKGYLRSRESLLRHAELLMTAASLGGSLPGRAAAMSSITALRRSVGVGQHHDAITGTEKQAVTNDYMLNLSLSTASISNTLSANVDSLLRKSQPGALASRTARTIDPGMLSLLGEPLPCGGGGGAQPPAPPASLGCVSWRQTAGCDPNGKREPQNDKPCDDPIPHGFSGYCECEGGVRREQVACDHGVLPSCEHACRSPPPAPPPADQCFGLHPAPARFNTSGAHSRLKRFLAAWRAFSHRWRCCVAAVVLHNSLGWEVSQTVRLVVNRSDLVVLSAHGVLLPSQLNPLSSYEPQTLPAQGQNFFPETENVLGFHSPTLAQGYSLYFLAELPPASLSTYFVAVDAAQASRGEEKDLAASGGVVENAHTRMVFSTSTGLLTSIANKDSGTNASIKQQLWQYKSGDKDGAYIFRPATRHALGTTRGAQCNLTVSTAAPFASSAPKPQKRPHRRNGTTT